MHSISIRHYFFKKIMMIMIMSTSIPMSTRHGFRKQLVAHSASTFIMMRSSVWQPQSASALSGTTPSKSSKSAMNSLITLTFMKVRPDVACGEDRIFAMVFYVDNMMNANLDAVAPSCLSLMIDVYHSLVIIAQVWTTVELNSHTKITTSIDKMT